MSFEDFEGEFFEEENQCENFLGKESEYEKRLKALEKGVQAIRFKLEVPSGVKLTVLSFSTGPLVVLNFIRKDMEGIMPVMLPFSDLSTYDEKTWKMEVKDSADNSAFFVNFTDTVTCKQVDLFVDRATGTVKRLD